MVLEFGKDIVKDTSVICQNGNIYSVVSLCHTPDKIWHVRLKRHSVLPHEVVLVAYYNSLQAVTPEQNFAIVGIMMPTKVRMDLSVLNGTTVILDGNPDRVLKIVKLFKHQTKGSYPWRVMFETSDGTLHKDGEFFRYSLTGKNQHTSMDNISAIITRNNATPAPPKEQLVVNLNPEQTEVTLVKGSKLIDRGALYVVRGFVDNLIVADKLIHNDRKRTHVILDAERLATDYDMLFVENEENLVSAPGGFCVRYPVIPDGCILATTSSARADFEILYDTQVVKVEL